MASGAVQDAEHAISMPERDEALIRERLETYRSIVAGNLADGFTQMPDQVRKDPTLSRAAKMVYEQLLCYTRQKDCCWPSQQRIADDIVTISRRTVARAIKELYQRGYIEVWRRGLNRTNIYYINPLSFAQSFKRPWRGRGVLLDIRSPEIRSSVVNTPVPDLLIGLSGKCQIVASRNDDSAHQEAPNWHIKHTESKDTKSEGDTDESKIRGGRAAELGKGTGEPDPTPTYSHIARKTIGREGVTNVCKTSGIEQIEISNQSNSEISSRPEQLKDVEEKKTSKKPLAWAEMAELVGISPEVVQGMEAWLKQCPRPEATPPLLEGVITRWSRSLGNAEPRLIKANITQASKIYKYARLQGLEQQTVEDCLSNAWDAVRTHPDVENKMGYFFRSFKMDVLIALKEQRSLPVTRRGVYDGYNDQEERDAEPPPAAHVPVEITLPEAGALEHRQEVQPGWSEEIEAYEQGKQLLQAIVDANYVGVKVALREAAGRYYVVYRVLGEGGGEMILSHEAEIAYLIEQARVRQL